jgi:hypothetical protein
VLAHLLSVLRENRIQRETGARAEGTRLIPSRTSRVCHRAVISPLCSSHVGAVCSVCVSGGASADPCVCGRSSCWRRWW